MTDPRRLLDDAALPVLERRCLTAARAAAPEPELVNEMWTALSLAVGAGVAGAAASSVAGSSPLPAAASAGGKLALLKALAVGAAIGAVTSGGTVAVTRAIHSAETHTTPAVAPPTSRAVREPTKQSGALTSSEVTAIEERRNESPKEKPAAAPSNPLPGVARVLPVVPENASAVAAFEAPSPVADETRLEAHLVGIAREALQHRDAASAYVVLEDARRRFPHGTLRQEREALTVSALVAMGRTAEASFRARAFLAAFPNSPHAAGVRAALHER